MRQRLQRLRPHAPEAVTSCVRGCGLMHQAGVVMNKALEGFVRQHVRSAVLAEPPPTSLACWLTLPAPGCAAHSRRPAAPLRANAGGRGGAVRPG